MTRSPLAFHVRGGYHLRERRVRRPAEAFVALDPAWIATYAPHQTVTVDYGPGTVQIGPCAVPYEQRFAAGVGPTVRRLSRRGGPQRWSVGVRLLSDWVRQYAPERYGVGYDARANQYVVLALDGPDAPDADGDQTAATVAGLYPATA